MNTNNICYTLSGRGERVWLSLDLKQPVSRAGQCVGILWDIFMGKQSEQSLSVPTSSYFCNVSTRIGLLQANTTLHKTDQIICLRITMHIIALITWLHSNYCITKLLVRGRGLVDAWISDVPTKRVWGPPLNESLVILWKWRCSLYTTEYLHRIATYYHEFKYLHVQYILLVITFLLLSTSLQVVTA